MFLFIAFSSSLFLLGTVYAGYSACFSMHMRSQGNPNLVHFNLKIKELHIGEVEKREEGRGYG